MHVYTAAVYTNSYMRGQNRYVKLNDREREIVHGLPHILESWHYVSKQKFVDDPWGNAQRPGILRLYQTQRRYHSR